MTTIQDRITENFRKQFYDEFGFCKNQYLLRDSNQFILEDFKQILLTSIKEVEEETKGDILDKLQLIKPNSKKVNMDKSSKVLAGQPTAFVLHTRYKVNYKNNRMFVAEKLQHLINSSYVNQCAKKQLEKIILDLIIPKSTQSQPIKEEWCNFCKDKRNVGECPLCGKEEEKSWTCKCGQKNSSWTNECGRCENPKQQSKDIEFEKIKPLNTIGLTKYELENKIGIIKAYETINKIIKKENRLIRNQKKIINLTNKKE